MWFKILKNLGFIISSIKSVQAVIGDIVRDKKLSVDNAKKLIDIARGLLDSGIVDIPNVDEAEISAALKKVEDNL